MLSWTGSEGACNIETSLYSIVFDSDILHLPPNFLNFVLKFYIEHFVLRSSKKPYQIHYGILLPKGPYHNFENKSIIKLKSELVYVNKHDAQEDEWLEKVIIQNDGIYETTGKYKLGNSPFFSILEFCFCYLFENFTHHMQ